MYFLRGFLITVLLLAASAAWGERITIAAASDLKFAMDEVVAEFKRAHPEDHVEVVYGSSGKFFSQIQQNAPYDLFFSADIGYLAELSKKGLIASSVQTYAFGRIVLWSNRSGCAGMTLVAVAAPDVKRIAIANPRHAPYGKRAEEALRSAGVWEKVSSKLVYGENIAHTFQFVQTGAADAGIIALSLAKNPGIASKGCYYLIPETMHKPLEQGFAVTARGGEKPLAQKFAAVMKQPETRKIMIRYGFTLPGAP